MVLIQFLLGRCWKVTLLAACASAISGLFATAIAAILAAHLGSAKFEFTGGLWFATACFGYVSFRSCAELLLMSATQSAVAELRLEVCRNLLGSALRDIQLAGKSKVTSVITNDIDNFGAVFQFISMAIGNGILIVTCLAYVAYLDVRAFCIFFALILIASTLYQRAESSQMRAFREARTKIDTLNAKVRELVDGVKELQLNLSRGMHFIDQVIAPSGHAARSAFIRSMGPYTVIQSAGTVAFYAIIGLLVYSVSGWLQMPTHATIAMSLTCLYLVRPISEMMYALPGLRSAEISLQRIQEFGNRFRSSAPVALYDALAKPKILRLAQICFAYEGNLNERFQIGPINLIARSGEITFLTGGNGAGKTTIAMLISGLYPASSGTIYIDEQPVALEALQNYRRHFSATFSDSHAFDFILENVDRSIAANYIELMELSGKVSIEGNRFSTVDLSAGQKKRLALIVACLEDRSIYLFDEWAADQDPKFRKLFYQKIIQDLRARGKIVIAITHDDTYFDVADQVIQFSEGCRI